MRSTSSAPIGAATRPRRSWRCSTPSRTRLFTTPANTLRMPQPLMDRMEIIRIPGYTEDEKVEIAKRHLIPKQIKAHGLKGQEWSISEEALRDLLRYYTRGGGR